MFFKKNKKGFTLVELLAVIVVLAIIALIGYSVVGDVISGAQDSADQRNIEAYAKSVETAVMSAQLSGTVLSGTLEQQWLEDNVKKTGNKVECKAVNMKNGTVQLISCGVGNSEKRYCFNNKEVTECEVNVLEKIYGASIQEGTPTLSTPVEIESVGDKTVNLLDFDKLFTGETITISGITYTKTLNGILVNGTSTDWAPTSFVSLLDLLEVGKTYTITGSGGNVGVVFMSTIDGTSNYSMTKTITGNETKLGVYLQVSPDKTVDNVLLQPQLQEGSVATSYEPYGYKIPIEASGKNLLENKSISTTINGVTFTKNSDGSITMNGTNTGSSNILYLINTDEDYAARNIQLKAGTYTISHGATLPKGIYLQAHFTEQGQVLYKTSPLSFTKSEDTDAGVYIRFDKGVTANNITIYPQLEEGATATEYVSYVKPITTNIYLDEPLRKVGDYVDYIDFETGKLVRQVKEIVLNDELNWQVSSEEYGYRAYIGANDKLINPIVSTVGLSNRFNIVNNLKNLGDFRIYVSASGSGLQFVQNLATDKAAWKNWVKQNNIVIHYAIDDEVTKINVPDELYQENYKYFKVNTSLQPSEIVIK